MTANKKPTAPAWIDPNDAPDLSAPEWRAKLDATPVTRPRGRPKPVMPKVPTNLRLSVDVLDAFKAGGAGWQTRIEAALREWLTARGELR